MQCLPKVLKKKYVLPTIRNNMKMLWGNYRWIFFCLLIFFKFLSALSYCESIFQFMRYTCLPNRLHDNCLQPSVYEKNVTRTNIYMGTVWCKFCLWDIEEAWSTVKLFSYVRILWKGRPWFNQKIASNTSCSVRCRVVVQEGVQWKSVLFAFVCSPF